MDEEGSTKTRPDSENIDAGTDQAEAYANDPANATQRDFVGEQKADADAKSNYQKGTGRGSSGASKMELNSVFKNKKFLLGGGGAGIAALLIASIIAFLPLKLEAIMKNIFQKRIGAKIEHMEQRRADRIVIKYLTKAGSNEAVYADGTLFGSLYKNWKFKNFEGKFSEKSGISISKGTDGHITLSSADGIKTGYANEADFQKFLDQGELKGHDARKFIRAVTRNETHWIQVYKRHNLRKFMRNAYGIHKWSWFTGKEGEKGASEFNGASVDTAVSQYGEDVSEIIDCTGGTNCPSDEQGREKPLGEPHDLGIGAAGAEGDGLKAATKSSIKDATDQVKKLSPKAAVDRVLTSILSTVMEKTVAEKVSSKVIPGVGAVLLIDQVARLDNFFRSGNADKALRAAHKVEYAKEYAKWASIADNFKDPNHKMSGAEFNAAMLKINDIAKSAAFNDVFLGKSGVTQIDPKLGISDLPNVNPVKEGYLKYASGTPVDLLILWTNTVDGNSVTKGIIDGLNGAIGDAVGVLFRIPGVRGVFDTLSAPFSGIIKDILHDVIAPAVDGTERDGSELNAIDAGGAVIGQDFSKSLGGHKMSTAQVYQENQAIAYDQKLAAPSLRDQLFSPDYQYSMVNHLAAVMPSSGGAALAQFSSYSIGVMKNPISIFGGLFDLITGKAHAGAPTNLYGLQDYGFTEAELDQPLTTLKDWNHDQKIDSKDCQTNEDGTPFSPDQMTAFNDSNQPQLCLLDVATAESLVSVFTDANDGGIGDDSNTSANAAPSGSLATTGNEQDLAKQIIANPNITFDLGPTGRIAQPFINLANGQKANADNGAPATDVSPSILNAILLAAKSHKINISSLTTGHQIGDVHSVGRAVDFNYVDGVHSTGRNSTDAAIINLLAPLLPAGSGFGQTADPKTHIACGPQIVLPAGIIQFEDTCNHIHIQVSA